MIARVHPIAAATGARNTAIVRLVELGPMLLVTAQCQCGAKVMPPFPIEGGLSETAAVGAAAMIAAGAQARCGTSQEAPGCRQKRENLAQPVGRNRPKRGNTHTPRDVRVIPVAPVNPVSRDDRPIASGGDSRG